MANILIPPTAAGARLSDWLSASGFEIRAECGGRGTCGKCRVTVQGGRFMQYTSGGTSNIEYIPDANGQILACKAVCTSSGARIILQDTDGSGLVAHKINAPAQQSGKAQYGYGVALDIGTTTLAASLINRATGEVIATQSALNPQRSYGADVISRIMACKEGHLDDLRRLICMKTAEIIDNFASRYPNTPDLLCVSGNTTMLHLFCGVSPEGIGTYPFTPAFTRQRDFKGEECGLKTEHMTLLPSASAYIGSDIIGGVYSSGMTQLKGPSLLMDIGTNGEMVLCTGREGGSRLIAASTAAGPALEGANISCGTGGIPGGVSHVAVECAYPYSLRYRTIGDKTPVGICGCGLIDLVAALLDAGIVDETGYMEEGDYSLCGAPHATARQVGEGGGEYKPTGSIPHIVLTQRDLREFQLAKSAIYAGFIALLTHAGIKPSELEKIYIAGGLGYYMNVASAMRVGLIEALDINKFSIIGNTSLAGAEQSLTNSSALHELSGIAEQCEILDLNTLPLFSELFMSNMTFPTKD